MENSSVFVMRSAILGEFGTLHSSWCMLVLSHWLRNQYIAGRFCQKKIQRFEHNYHPGIPFATENQWKSSFKLKWMIYNDLHMAPFSIGFLSTKMVWLAPRRQPGWRHLGRADPTGAAIQPPRDRRYSLWFVEQSLIWSNDSIHWSIDRIGMGQDHKKL